MGDETITNAPADSKESLSCNRASSAIIDDLSKTVSAVSDVCIENVDESQDNTKKSEILDIIFDAPTEKEDKPKNTSSDKIQKHKSDIFFLDIDEHDKSEDKPEDKSDNLPIKGDCNAPRNLNKMRDHASSIFPAGCMGCRDDPPSDHVTSPRRFIDANEAKDYAGHIDNTPRKRPPSVKPHNCRNPLTGVGMAEAEVKKFNGRRKDGNPLLGEGYSENVTVPSTTRIPPGGYSQGLW